MTGVPTQAMTGNEEMSFVIVSLCHYVICLRILVRILVPDFGKDDKSRK